MLGAATSGAVSLPVNIPPRASELTPQAQRDWKTGVELIETCMQTHDTATGLAPEIVHFRIPSDGVVGSGVPSDWYIKGARYVLVAQSPAAGLNAHAHTLTDRASLRRTTRGTSCARRRSSRSSSRTG